LTVKRLSLALAVALATVVAAAPVAHARRTTIVAKVANLQFGQTIQDCDPGDGVTFDLASPSGAEIGSGTGCITGFASDCAPLPGCHETVNSTLTLIFDGRGAVVAPSLFQQTDLPNGLSFRSTGDITSGTGEFAGATGVVTGQGIIFADFSTNATYVLSIAYRGGGEA
jgi:hypothetical protein